MDSNGFLVAGSVGAGTSGDRSGKRKARIEGYAHLLVPVAIWPSSDSIKFTPRISKLRPLATRHGSEVGNNSR